MSGAERSIEEFLNLMQVKTSHPTYSMRLTFVLLTSFLANCLTCASTALLVYYVALNLPHDIRRLWGRRSIATLLSVMNWLAIAVYCQSGSSVWFPWAPIYHTSSVKTQLVREVWEARPNLTTVMFRDGTLYFLMSSILISRFLICIREAAERSTQAFSSQSLSFIHSQGDSNPQPWLSSAEFIADIANPAAGDDSHADAFPDLEDDLDPRGQDDASEGRDDGIELEEYAVSPESILRCAHPSGSPARRRYGRTTHLVCCFSVAPSRSAIYVLPVDPRAPPRHTTVRVDAESLWSEIPAAAAPKPPKTGTTHVFYVTPSENGAHNVTALTSLGDKFAEKAEDERRKVVRQAVWTAVKQTKPPSPFHPNLKEGIPDKLSFQPLTEHEGWKTGAVYARAQNLARTAFVERIERELSGVPIVEIINAFLSVTKGTSEPAKLLEMKGVTFDTGRISLMPSAWMKLTRGDMGTAAAVCSAALAVAQLGLVYAMNGKSVDNTNAGARLVLAGADRGSRAAKGEAAADNSDSLWRKLGRAGAREQDRFWRMPLDDEYGPQIHSSNADLCNIGGRAAISCTDALFLKAFVDGVEPGKDGATAVVRWAHLDIAGTMETTRGYAYQDKGLTGCPTRTDRDRVLLQFYSAIPPLARVILASWIQVIFEIGESVRMTFIPCRRIGDVGCELHTREPWPWVRVALRIDERQRLGAECLC
ncbi:hypothetical protein POSPLADRAFT_1127730 [Postia placenta MAD-698-R-SB12]|uniref:Cytosol aminopeptidase domain-containing protein n=1 Tax=Postia placenta MAD-698-R-SB12 TaxID=670580 RepID=A0A1X6NHQ0_9APHY|nr:hypothetical protein POSPLADRAFT_1127730 [Postia placenta MAD-698-R-SB12]OSX68139.1 hypothetical protein POSPLADRAFT_1127730 [Postia placenta MAD-698-R-SB12]